MVVMLSVSCISGALICGVRVCRAPWPVQPRGNNSRRRTGGDGNRSRKSQDAETLQLYPIAPCFWDFKAGGSGSGRWNRVLCG